MGRFLSDATGSFWPKAVNPDSAALVYVEFERDVFAHFLFIKRARSYKDKATCISSMSELPNTYLVIFAYVIQLRASKGG